MGVVAGEALEGREIGGKFRLGKRLSEDPSGSIYAAIDIGRERDVLALALTDKARLDGVQKAKSLRHPNLLAFLFAALPVGAQRFAVFEAPAGRSLAEIIEKRGALHPGPSANVALQILSALHAIHSLGGFHGNLNPHNVFLNRTDAGELDVRILYAGSVRADASPATVHYCAPEQVLGESVDRRADLWAVGALLYLCLFGRPPFDGNSLEEISGKILLKDLVFPKDSPKQPSELLASIRAALAKEPENRPQSANNMMGELLAIAEEFEEKMSALVAAALRVSIHPGELPSTVPPPAAPLEESPLRSTAPPPVAAPSGEVKDLADDTRVLEAQEITAALERELGIDLIDSVPPSGDLGGRGERRQKRKRVIAAACLFAALAAVAGIVLGVVSTAKNGATSPPPKSPAPVATPEVVTVESPTPSEPPSKEKESDAAKDPSPPASPEGEKSGPAKLLSGKRQKGSREKAAPSPKKGAAGLASNPFGG